MIVIFLCFPISHWDNIVKTNVIKGSGFKRSAHYGKKNYEYLQTLT